jgi:hypothetical protein
MDIKLETNIPMPPKPGTGRKEKYPWAAMNVGDSFFAPGVPGATMSQNIRGTKKRYPGTAYAYRTVDGGVRVWRTA